MEQTRTAKTNTRNTFTILHAAGLLLILCTAAAIWFGIHPKYRFLSVGVLLLGVLAAWKRNWMFWIALAAEACFIIFLWTFPQNGYKIASLAPIAIVVMMLIFRFCKKPVKIIASILMGLCALALLIVEIPIVKAAADRSKQDAPYVVFLT